MGVESKTAAWTELSRRSLHHLIRPRMLYGDAHDMRAAFDTIENKIENRHKSPEASAVGGVNLRAQLKSYEVQ